MCPEQEAISLTHNDPGSDGTSSLTCSFRYPPGKLFYYQWLLRSKNELIFYHIVRISMALHAFQVLHLFISNFVDSFTDGFGARCG